ncbi:multicopper oxidase family protein [Phytopseudomonas seleniipraecipitans]|uniref:Multicopper oxidase with three cupredoxin domains (Includes cell division protein FtsP and spore coat protein CotA) n=1 Tax=Phytopseudomonas seleniipraecipitans TaxID=640205 RepID=A0A1G7GZZ0_9GAMM|nr:multicopper oxidase family protein [Pseudomonas seleniipraecipitans]SDE93740.1 Multicopper oxidase with three cupredoxin domains (includes cell division protein FtsP and spore coat protein CotA) [Pseudomonas seleniipraecipitans]
MSFTRRQVLGGLIGLGVVGLGAGGARYWLGRPFDRKTHDYELIAAPHDIELVPGHVTPAWAFGGQAPGVELRCRQGDELRVRFINHLPEATTIHWHGIRLPLEMDGVPYVSQLPVLPGEYFDYRFIVPDAGSYWYHPHQSSAEQLGRGLVGPLIIEEREPSGFLHERTLCLKSWHVDKEGAFTAFSVPREAAREGTRGRLSTINGVSLPTLELPAGQVVRLRLINVDNTVTYRLNLPKGEARLYALDGNPIAPRPLGKEYWLGPGMRIDLALKVPEVGADELSLRNGPLRLATIKAVASNDAAGEWPPALPANPVAEPDLSRAETLRFNFEWAAALASPADEAAGRYKYWQINGEAWDINDKTCADRPIAKLKKDGHYIFVLRNMAQYQHPIHLHGLIFKVLDSNRRKIEPYYTDTFLLGKNETARIAFVADNPGVWMFHCHVIDHMETGLMAAIEIA